MRRIEALLALVALALLPGCQLINTILQLAPNALLFLEAPAAVDAVSPDAATAALPLDEALERGLAAGAEGDAWLVPVGATPPAEAIRASGPGLLVCRLAVAETEIPPDLAGRMARRGLQLLRVPVR